MKVLFISQYFFPEMGAPSNRSEAIIKSMIRHGHKVKVLCGMPNHPYGVIFPAYRGKFTVCEDHFGAEVHYLPQFTSPKKSFLPRVLMFLSFSFSACCYLLFKRPRYDLMYISSPPLFSAFGGLLGKLIFPKRKTVFEVRDLWPDSAIELGELRNSILIKLSLWLEAAIYRRSDLVIGATRHIGKVITGKGIDPAKIYVGFNGVDQDILDSYAPEAERNPDTPYRAIYAGNIGIAQGMEIVIEAAKLMRQEHIEFILLGSGPAIPHLKELVAKDKLTNVRFLPHVPREEVGAILFQADLGLLPLKDISVLSGALPTKMFAYMAYELPVVASLKGEAAEEINKAEAGIIVPPGDAAGLVHAIRSLMADVNLAKRMGSKGREYVLQNYQRDVLADKIVDKVETLFRP